MTGSNSAESPKLMRDVTTVYVVANRFEAGILPVDQFIEYFSQILLDLLSYVFHLPVCSVGVT